MGDEDSLMAPIMIIPTIFLLIPQVNLDIPIERLDQIFSAQSISLLLELQKLL